MKKEGSVIILHQVQLCSRYYFWFSVKAMIKFSGTASADAFWEVQVLKLFHNKFGINRISIYGEGHVMQPLKFLCQINLKKASLKLVKKKLNSKEILEKLKNREFISSC
jgi:hypothetical protein